MNTDFLRPGLTKFRAVEQFTFYFMDFYGDDGFYPEVRKFMVGYCEDISRVASDLYDELIYSLLSKMDFLDFLDSLDKEYKINVLTLNGINAINDDDELFILLKDLGEEKVLKTLCIL